MLYELPPKRESWKPSLQKQPFFFIAPWLNEPRIVEMYEWDESHCWRRIRILAIRDEGGMQVGGCCWFWGSVARCVGNAVLSCFASLISLSCLSNT